VKCKLKGPVSWTIQDDQGQSHNIVIPDTPLCPALPHRLLSPQHWAQETERRSCVTILGKDTPSCITTATATTLSWGKGKFHKTVFLDCDRNVAVMSTKSGNSRCAAFAASVKPLEPSVCCFLATGAPTTSTTVVTDDEDSDTAESDNESTAKSDNESTTSSEQGAKVTQPVTFEGLSDVPGVSIKNDTPLDKDKDELYRVHVCAGHLSFAKLRAMAQRGEVPARLAKCDSPMCAACEFGKATRKPWRTKLKSRHVQPATAPGQCVSVDQMESRDVGFVTQLKGCLTHGRYRVATIFVDHFSRIGYVHLQKDTSSAETIKAKDTFELFARECGVRIQHYYADNGRFVDNAWKEGLAQEN
jgi:hypothetical protein